MCKNVHDDADDMTAQQVISAKAVVLHDDSHLKLAFSSEEEEYEPTNDMSVSSGESSSEVDSMSGNGCTTCMCAV